MSYPIDLASVQQSFPGVPMLSLVEGRLGLGEFLDEDSLSTFTRRFAQTLVDLSGHGYKCIHLVIAAPSSVAIAIGRVYDGRNMPQAIVYQFQKDQETNQYPWGVMLPTSDRFQGSYVEHSLGKAIA